MWLRILRLPEAGGARWLALSRHAFPETTGIAYGLHCGVVRLGGITPSIVKPHHEGCLAVGVCVATAGALDAPGPIERMLRGRSATNAEPSITGGMTYHAAIGAQCAYDEKKDASLYPCEGDGVCVRTSPLYGECFTKEAAAARLQNASNADLEGEEADAREDDDDDDDDDEEDEPMATPAEQARDSGSSRAVRVGDDSGRNGGEVGDEEVEDEDGEEEDDGTD